MPDTSAHERDFTAEIVSQIAPADNIGLLRVNWRPEQTTRAICAVLAVEGSECQHRIAEAVKLINGSEMIWSGPLALMAEAQNGGSRPHASPKTLVAPISAKHISDLSRLDDVSAICVLDDPITLANNIEHTLSKPDMAQAMAERAAETAKAIKEMSRFSGPVMYISAAKARTFPDATALEIATFLGSDVSAELLRTAAQYIDDRGPKYRRPLSRVFDIKGYLNRQQQPGKVMGWAKRSLSDERIFIEVRKNGQAIAEGLADKSRDDLIANKIGDGYHGFEIQLPEILTEQSERFEIAAPHFGTVIGFIDMSLSKATLSE